LGKLALSAAAVATGQGLFANGAEAAGGVPLHCCSGHACRRDGCPSGTKVKYTWSCGHYFCHDCFHAVRRGRYACTYTIHKLVR
jgi:hypothetical protein